jgi:hypothetical protein
MNNHAVVFCKHAVQIEPRNRLLFASLRFIIKQPQPYRDIEYESKSQVTNQKKNEKKRLAMAAPIDISPNQNRRKIRSTASHND